MLNKPLAETEMPCEYVEIASGHGQHKNIFFYLKYKLHVKELIHPPPPNDFIPHSPYQPKK